MIKNYTLLLFIILLTFSSKAQQIPQTFQGKTHMMDESEMKHLNNLNKDFIETAAPTGTVRNIAEFERTEGIIVTYLSSYYGSYFGIPEDLIAEISDEAYVYTVVKDTNARNEVKQIYIDNSVNTDNVIYVYSQADSYWTRDYSPWFIENNNQVAIVNFPYNRPRPNDNDLPKVFGDFLDMDVFGMNLISTGGNYMTDGMGVSASCDLVYEENPSLSEQEVAVLAKNYLGISNYHLVPDPLDDYIEHIDCWGKFLDVDKILLTQVPTNDPRYGDFEAMADYWGNQTSSYGNKYQVFRVFSPNGQPYTNSLILNNKVLVPIVSGYGSDYNDDALQVYQNAMPGYEIIGFEQNPGAPWQSTDALHCRTHEVPDLEMLHIYHLATLDTLPYSTTSVTIEAAISSYGGNDIQEAVLVYKLNDGEYQEQVLVAETKTLNSYQTTIDNILPGDSIYYYIKAKDASGRIEAHPFIGESDPHKFYIAENNISISQNKQSTDFNIYPNPAKNNINLTFNDFVHDNYELKIMDLNGKVVYSQTINIANSWEKKKIDISPLNSGVYFATIKNSTTYLGKRIVVN